MDELRKVVKGKEREVIGRDKVITELRVRLPASAERDDMIMKTVMKHTQFTSGVVQEEDFESRQAMRVAQSTVASLQVSTHSLGHYHRKTLRVGRP